MPQVLSEAQRRRNLLFLGQPRLWPVWPFLPLIRPRGADDYDCGLLCDLHGWVNLAGYRCTVFHCNLLLLPRSLDEFIAQPREPFDTFEDLLAAGWRID